MLCQEGWFLALGLCWRKMFLSIPRGGRVRTSKRAGVVERGDALRAYRNQIIHGIKSPSGPRGAGIYLNSVSGGPSGNLLSDRGASASM